jgi:hypothetical protein
MTPYYLTDFPDFPGQFAILSSEKKTEAAAKSETFRNSYKAARRGMLEVSINFLVCDFWVTVNFPEVYLFCSN